jgi:hypothetical protein
VPINEILLRDSPVNDIPINEVGLPRRAAARRRAALDGAAPAARRLGQSCRAPRSQPSVAERDAADVFELSPAPAFIATLALSDLDLSNSPSAASPPSRSRSAR